MRVVALFLAEYIEDVSLDNQHSQIVMAFWFTTRRRSNSSFQEMTLNLLEEIRAALGHQSEVHFDKESNGLFSWFGVKQKG